MLFEDHSTIFCAKNLKIYEHFMSNGKFQCNFLNEISNSTSTKNKWISLLSECYRLSTIVLSMMSTFRHRPCNLIGEF